MVIDKIKAKLKNIDEKSNYVIIKMKISHNG
jgi:hypothetical protein